MRHCTRSERLNGGFMTSQTAGLVFAERKIEEWTVPTIEFSRPSRRPLRVPVNRKIINSTTENSNEQKKWKAQVAYAVKAKRGPQPWCERDKYAISLAMCFHPGNHGNRKQYKDLDVDNYVKPILDAIAGGLFCPNSTELCNISSWDCNDSNFNTLLIHRLSDARTPAGEGIAISVSAR